jgi:hypothetical protein
MVKISSLTNTIAGGANGLLLGSYIGLGAAALTKKKPHESKKHLTKRKVRNLLISLGISTVGGAALGAMYKSPTYDYDFNFKFDKEKFNEDFANWRNKYRNRSYGNYNFYQSSTHKESPFYEYMKNAKTKDEATNIYRNLARKHHLDKFSQAPLHVQEEATKKMQNLNAFWDNFKESRDFNKLAMLAFNDELEKILKYV